MKKLFAVLAMLLFMGAPVMAAEIDIVKTFAYSERPFEFETNCGDCWTEVDFNPPREVIVVRPPNGGGNDPFLLWNRFQGKGDFVEQKQAIGQGYSEFAEITNVDYAEGLLKTKTWEKDTMNNKKSSYYQEHKNVDDQEKMTSSVKGGDSWYKGSASTHAASTKSEWGPDSEQSSVSSSTSIVNSGWFFFEKEIAFDGTTTYQK